MNKPCPRCGGWVYTDDPAKKKPESWCLMCGEDIKPPDFKPLPFVARNDDPLPDSSWFINDEGEIIDIIDIKVEEFAKENNFFTVSAVSKKVQCSNNEARYSLQRLVKNGTLLEYRYGPQNRWVGYKRSE